MFLSDARPTQPPSAQPVMGCIYRRASVIAKTRAELKAISEARSENREDTRSLRLHYMDDIQPAQSSYRFQTIVFDGMS